MAICNTCNKSVTIFENKYVCENKNCTYTECLSCFNKETSKIKFCTECHDIFCFKHKNHEEHKND